MCHFRLGMSAFLSIFKLIGIALTNVGTFFPEKRITSCIGQCDLNYLCRHRSRNPPPATPPPPLRKKAKKRKKKGKRKRKHAKSRKNSKENLAPTHLCFLQNREFMKCGNKTERSREERKQKAQVEGQ